MSTIKFDIQIFNGERLGWKIRMNVILTQSGLKKALLKKEKKHENMNEKFLPGVGWESLEGYSALLSGQIIGWAFFRENNILALRATSRSLSEEVVGESVNSEVTSLSSPHGWKYTYQVSESILRGGE